MDARPKLVFSSPQAISERERAELETAINAALAEADPTGAERCNLAAPSPSKFALDLGTATILLAVLKGGSAAVVTRLIFAVAGHVRSRNRVIEIQAGPNVKLTVHSRLLEDPGAKKNVLEFLERMGALAEPGAQDKVGRLIDAKTATPPSAPVPT